MIPLHCLRTSMASAGVCWTDGWGCFSPSVQEVLRCPTFLLICLYFTAFWNLSLYTFIINYFFLFHSFSISPTFQFPNSSNICVDLKFFLCVVFSVLFLLLKISMLSFSSWSCETCIWHFPTRSPRGPVLPDISPGSYQHCLLSSCVWVSLTEFLAFWFGKELFSDLNWGLE